MFLPVDNNISSNSTRLSITLLRAVMHVSRRTSFIWLSWPYGIRLSSHTFPFKLTAVIASIKRGRDGNHSSLTIFMNDRSGLTIVHDLLDVRIYRHKAHHHAWLRISQTQTGAMISSQVWSSKDRNNHLNTLCISLRKQSICVEDGKVPNTFAN